MEFNWPNQIITSNWIITVSFLQSLVVEIHIYLPPALHGELEINQMKVIRQRPCH